MSEQSAYELEKTIRAGGRVTVIASDFSACELEKLVRASRMRNGSVTILEGEKLSGYEQERVARSGAILYVDARSQ